MDDLEMWLPLQDTAHHFYLTCCAGVEQSNALFGKEISLLKYLITEISSANGWPYPHSSRIVRRTRSLMVVRRSVPLEVPASLVDEKATDLPYPEALWSSTLPWGGYSAGENEWQILGGSNSLLTPFDAFYPVHSVRNILFGRTHQTYGQHLCIGGMCKQRSNQRQWARTDGVVDWKPLRIQVKYNLQKKSPKKITCPERILHQSNKYDMPQPSESSLYLMHELCHGIVLEQLTSLLDGSFGTGIMQGKQRLIFLLNPLLPISAAILNSRLTPPLGCDSA